MANQMPQFSTFHISDPSKTQTFRGRPSKGCNKCRSRKVKASISYVIKRSIILSICSVTKDTRLAKDVRGVELLASIETNSTFFSAIRQTKQRRLPRKNGEADPKNRQPKASLK